MVWDRIQSRWDDFEECLARRWEKLTHDDLDIISGRRDQLRGKIQEKYRLTRDEAERQLRQWQDSLAFGETAKPRP